MRLRTSVSRITLSLTALLAACTKDEPAGSGDEGILSLGDDEDATGANGSADEGSQRFDTIPDEGGMIPCEEAGDCPECEVPEHIACDSTTDPGNAIGVNCPGEMQIQVQMGGSPAAYGIRSGFGVTNAFDPREGAKYAVLGSGLLADLDQVTPPGDFGLSPTHCNDDLGAFDPGTTLPPPLVPMNVGAQTCAENPSLVGMGDCSNTIQGQWDQGNSANDYTEMRLTATVPSSTNSFSYDFAFFSVEYPDYYKSAFNDMYVAWLESEVWTGNVSFDEQGNPISLNAGFLDYRDSPNPVLNDPACANGCSAPELHGTCMQEHAGTKWLATTAGVAPGEQVTIVFAIFDLSDSILDSYVFLDNFRWGCEGDQPPSTVPIG
jgi:hypothetical protein